jgi:parvulin-like peptidyl-prolyl cis-trans isomerase-like protein
MKMFFREPLVHFLLIGAGLFLLFGWRGGPASLPAGQSGPQPTRIVVPQGDIDEVTATFTRTWQRPPSEEEAKVLVEDLVRNEIYYREALAIGLDREDSIIRRRMRLKMEFIFEDIAAQTEPTDEELLAYMKKHPDSYLVDPQIAFRHVYVNAAKRGKSAGTEALGILAQLDAGADPDAIGDPFLLASEVPLSPLWDISKQFGEPFSRKLLGLKPGSWTGPVQSGFGLHLVLVRKRVGGRLPELKEARETVKRDLMVERQKELKDAAYAKLRERYVVVVEKTKVEDKTASTDMRGGARR